MLHFKQIDPMFLVPALMFVVFGLSAAVAFLPWQFKKTLLSFDREGRRTLVLGIGCIVAGLVINDYAAAYSLVCIGLAMAMLGAWIAVRDEFTNKWLGRQAAKYYAFFAIMAFVFGSMLVNERAFYNLYGLMRLILPVGGAAFFASLTVLALSSKKFQARMLPQDRGGFLMATTGLVVLLIAPLVGVNPALMIAVSSLGCCLLSLGLLIAVNDRITGILLKREMVPAYLVGMYLLFSYARVSY